MNGRKRGRKLISLILSLVMLVTMFSMPAVSAAGSETTSSDYRIVHLDCGRKYFSVDNIKSIIDTASAAGFNYLELAVGNDGLRYLLDDMSVTVGETSYSSEKVTTAIQTANKAYYDAGDKNELTQAEMDTIIAHAKEKGMSVIPLLNTPGHMNAIVSAMETLGIDGDYNGSANTIDITNETAVAFTKALVQKYLTYFAGKECTVFNFGADEYANDKYSTGGMGFAQLVSAGQYDEFVAYVNELAAMVKNAGMTPMAFNDGIYYNSNTATAIDTDILVAYWTCGWSGYNVASASFLSEQGFQLINTNGDYYWVLGKTNAQCSAEKAAGFDVNTFIGNDTISGTPAGAMFCIWCDVPGADTADNVVTNTAATITAFGKALTGTTDSGSGDGNGEATTESTVTAIVDDATISVTASGLTDVTVSANTSANVSIAGVTEYKVYDIMPKTANGDYTGEATVTLPVPETWTNVRGGVLASDGNEEVMGIEGTLDTTKHTFTFTVPHFSSVIVYNLEEAQQENITITAGGTSTATIEGVNLTGTDVVIGDNAVVTDVTVTGTDGQEAATTYAQASVNCYGLISNTSSSWQATGYYYQANDGNYYPLYAQRTNRSWDWEEFANVYTYTWGYSTTASDNNVTTIDTQKESNTSATPNITVYSRSGTEAVPASTIVTFTAGEVGTTTVTIGNIQYNINVVEEDLTNAATLTIEYWITNAKVTGSDGNTSIDITAAQAYGENGVAISTLVPSTGTHTTNSTVYWKARRLPYAYRQIIASGGGVDRCTDTNGTDITHIRYWQGEWSYSSDGTTWTEVQSNDQIVAYYMQVSTVTDEVTTVFVDYGVERASWGDAGWLNGKYVRLDFAVRYPSGERVPDSFSTDKSLLYHCDNVGPYRTLKPILGLETAEYEIYMITLTPTSDDSNADFENNTTSTQTYSYGGTEKVAWAATQEDLDNSGMEEWTSISGDYTCVIGGNPELQAVEIYNLQGMRVTYYLRAKVTEDSLTVHYVDKTDNYEFYNYNIAVKNGTVFNEGIALPNPWKGNLTNGTVTNSNDRTQTVSSDLSTLTELSNAYKDRDYTCVKVTRSEDGKDVYLYYTFNDTHEVVYDYGLPITVPASELGLQNAATVIAGTAHYGIVTVNNDKSVTYTPNTMSPKIEDVTLTATFTDTDAENTTRTVLRAIPATSVYYEDNSGRITFSDGWTTTEGTQSGTQAYNTIPYGYDAAYTSNTTYSNGSAHTVTINQNQESQTATFTFTGTGFDIYSTSGPNSGLMKVQVSNDNGVVKTVSVQNTGKTTLYQVPVVSINDLAHGTYNVTVTAYAAYTDNAYQALSRGGEHVIDAVVIYNPLANDASKYTTDNEANVVRLEVRDAIIEAQEFGDNSTGEGVLYLNADGIGTVEDYTIVGPNNEAYLSNSHAIGFILETSAEVSTLQIGAKSADGKTVNMKTSVNETITTKQIATCTAMNYVVNCETATADTGGKYQYKVYISNTGSGVLSITDVKATFAEDATAEFKYNASVVSSLQTPTEAAAKITDNGVNITSSRVRYGRNMTIEVTTDKEIGTEQEFTVSAGNRTYTTSGTYNWNKLTVSEAVVNDDETYTYTLTLKPYVYNLFSQTTFTVTLSDSNGTGTSGTASAKVYLM